MAEVTINGTACRVDDGATVLIAAARHGVYIPTLCHHPDLPPFHELAPVSRVFRGQQAYDHQSVTREEWLALEGCGLCVVQIDGEDDPVRACHTPIRAGMSIQTETDALRARRRTGLMRILANHPHACLTCAQREGCSLEDCSSNVPKAERCCPRFHQCELRKVAEYVGVKEETPRYRPAGLPVLNGEPLFSRDFNLCIDCARCVRVCRDVRGVDAIGLVHHQGRLVVGSAAPTLTDSACKFCGACVEVCPTGCLTDNVEKVGDREHWLVPCIHACPAGVNVPAYIRRIASGDVRGAAALIWEQLPLANVLGHVCFHVCEVECRRGRLDDPLAICALKRFALEADDGVLLTDAVRPADSGRKVAVIGAGPAGLTAACFLRLKGHAITVFEAAEAAGGMPALSIPAYRLPSEVLERDLGIIRGLGVDVKTGCRITTTGHEMADLPRRGFDAVLIAVGLPHSKRIPVEGSDLDGVLWGLEFLSAVKRRETFELGERVIVVGGGNVAIDVAMTAGRVAGGTVRLFCLESRDEMPAHAHEIELAEAEGIEVNPGWGPISIRGEHGEVGGVEFRRCTAVFDERRKFAPTFDDSQRLTVEADTVILAVGQTPAADVPAEGDGIFLAGDVAATSGGGASVIEAVASGRSAAERIDRHLGGDGRLSIELTDHPLPSPRIGREDGFAPRRRVPFPRELPEERCADFRLIQGTYPRQDAVAEAKRCLQCDLRLRIGRPPTPPETWMTYDRAIVEHIPEAEGVVILADAEKIPVVIQGAMNIRAALVERLDAGVAACFVRWEEDRMYTKRESELIQQHLAQYGELPGGGGDELDDLF